jgi:hypothetical protein
MMLTLEEFDEQAAERNDEEGGVGEDDDDEDDDDDEGEEEGYESPKDPFPREVGWRLTKEEVGIKS